MPHPTEPAPDHEAPLSPGELGGRAAREVPRPGSSLAAALKLVPAARRPALALWLRTWHEISRIPLSVQDPGVAETKLAWWRQEISEAIQGRARHPLMREWLALAPAASVASEAHPMPWDCWHAHIDGLIQLTHQTRWMDEASLQRHAQQTTGNACVVAAHLLGVHGAEAVEAIRQLGQGLRQSHALARLGQDARAGWVMVGIDWLQTHGVKAHQLSRPERPMPEGWDALLAALHQRTYATLKGALAAMQALPSGERRALKPLLYLAHHALAQADAVRNAGETVLHQRVVLTPLRKAWMAQLVRWSWLR